MSDPTFRLITWPDFLGIVDVDYLSGPASRTSGSNTASDGSEQSFAAVDNRLAIRVSLMPANRTRARRQRGVLQALRAGDVGVRLSLPDPDRMTLTEAGVNNPPPDLGWSENVDWSDGATWGVSYPLVTVGANAAVDATQVTLANEHWGHSLGLGDIVGFAPDHFGWYFVVGVEASGTYRIWPRLRKAVTTADSATLQPTAVFRAVANSVAFGRGQFVSRGSLDMLEVTDPEVRTYYTIG